MTGRLPGVVRILRALPVVAVMALLAACSIPNMSEPAVITPAATPARAAVPASPGASGQLDTSVVFLVDGSGKLVPVRRAPASGDTTTQVTQVLSQLTAGPDPDEQSRGLSSAIPPGLSVMLEGVDGSKAIVDIEGTDPGPATEEARLATAQVVLTLTSLPQVDSVLLKRNGQPHAVLPDGELTEQPLTREDVVSLLQQ